MLHIKVVGTGCTNCNKLESMCKEVISENNIRATLEKVSDFSKFPELGIFMTPGLIINDQVMSSGKLPTKSTLTNWILSSNK